MYFNTQIMSSKSTAASKDNMHRNSFLYAASCSSFGTSKMSFDDTITDFGYGDVHSEHDEMNDETAIYSIVDAQTHARHDMQPLRPIRRSTFKESHFHHRPSVWLFGCDDTEHAFTGWGASLASAYSRRADILNRGFDGYNTLHALRVFPQIFGKIEHPILFVTIWFGLHDASIGTRHVTLEEYKENIAIILKKFRVLQRTSFPILLLTPAPVNNRSQEKLSKDSYSNEMAREYGEGLKEVCLSDENCAVIDVWESLRGNSQERAQFLCDDGIHLNEKGNAKVYETLMATVRRLFPHVFPMEYNNDGEPILASGVGLAEATWKELVE